MSHPEKVQEKFHTLKKRFNEGIMHLLFKLSQVVEPDAELDVDLTAEEKTIQSQNSRLLNQAYERWYDTFAQDGNNMTLCENFYQAVGEDHVLLKSRNPQILTSGVQDLFATIYEQPGLNSTFLYESLSDGGDGNVDAKEELWNSLHGLYRMCLLICVYLRIPVVHEMINFILSSHQDLNQQNVVNKVFGEFHQNRKFRKLIYQITKDGDDSIEQIFTSFQKVIVMFSDELPSDPSEMVKKMQQRNTQLVRTVVVEQKLDHLFENETLLQEFCDSVLAKKEQEFVDRGVISSEQVQALRSELDRRGVQNVDVTQMMSTLGSSLEEMMKAVKNNDEEAVRNILANSGLEKSLDVQKLQQELESDTIYEEDEEDEEDEKVTLTL